jgi:Xaa-Pro aminopeptidase
MQQPVVKPKAYLKVRHKNLREAMKALNLDAVMLTHPPDLAYLSNFTGEDSVGVFTKKDFYLVTDFRYTEQAGLESAWLSIVAREGKLTKMADALARTLKDAGLKRVGFEVNFTTVGQYDGLKDALKSAKHDCELVPLEDVLLNLRKVKDDHEINLIRKSADVAEEALNAVRAEIQAGQTEGYLAGLLIMEMKARGASDPSFPPIVATGSNSSLPHYRPGEKTILNDALLLFDWGAKVEGYCSDLTRTFALGRVPAKLKKIHGIVLEAQLAAIDFLRPGVTTRQTDQVARDVIAKAGFDKYFGHGLGHGIGRDIHELPSMRKTGEGEELRPGMIVTVEPGIYLPGEGGVRIEDDVLITHSGCEVLSSLPKSFEDCHIE